MSPRPRRPPCTSAVGTLLLLPALAANAAGQSVGDASRLAGVDVVGARVEAQWDESITVEAGGATDEQFLQALGTTFESTLSSAEMGPRLESGSAVTVTCHVDTYYETGLIVYSLRTQVEEEGADGRPVITWIRSWVGSFSTQQLHRMFTLGEQCAESFLTDWRSVN